MADEEPGITIGLREIYDEVVASRADIQSVTRTVADEKERTDDHEARIRAIERWKYALPIASLLAVGSTVATFYSK
jgi:hypothetical protein